MSGLSPLVSSVDAFLDCSGLIFWPMQTNATPVASFCASHARDRRMRGQGGSTTRTRLAVALRRHDVADNSGTRDRATLLDHRLEDGGAAPEGVFLISGGQRRLLRLLAGLAAVRVGLRLGHPLQQLAEGGGAQRQTATPPRSTRGGRATEPPAARYPCAATASPGVADASFRVGARLFRVQVAASLRSPL